MANTTNFNWETPDDTDLVKDGALAIRTLGNSIDTSMVDLKGGTTGQVLSKTSNTDMDFTWVTTDDANAIQNAIVDAKGDLIAASAADTPARLAVGNNGEFLVADSSASTGLRWQGDYAAGKNAIINGDFRINQRSFSSTTTSGVYMFDRWTNYLSDGTVTYSTQTFTPGTAPVAGYEAVNFIRCVTSGQTAAGAAAQLAQPIEDVRTFAGQTVTVSFWAKAATGTPKIGLELAQNFGSGGSSTVFSALGAITISTSWARYSVTYAVPSISGKTIGTSGFLGLNLWTSAGTTFATRASSIGIQSATIDIWGVQIEPGNTATAFQTATGTIAGELAACQRYYYRLTADTAFTTMIPSGFTATTTRFQGFAQHPVTMRVGPTSVEYSTLQVNDVTDTGFTISAVTLSQAAKSVTSVDFTITGGTAARFGSVRANNSTSAYLGFSAEL